MATIQRVLLLTLFSFSSLLGGNTPRPSLTQHRISLELFPAGTKIPSQNTATQLFQETTRSEKKSVALAALYSLLVPGMGEIYTGEFSSSGKYFLIAEGALWLTFTVFEVYGNALQTDSRSFAVANAGIDPSGKDDQFYVDISNFLNVYDYNEAQLRDRELRQVYDPAGGYAWQWNSDASRQLYRDQRISSVNMFNNEKFIVAAVIVNHVLSAINAGRTAVLHNREVDRQSGGLEIQADVLGGIGHVHGIQLSFTHRF